VQRTINPPFLYTLATIFHHSTMKYTTVCAAFFAAVAAASDVKQLKTDNFKSFIEENDLVLAECK
jgi:L-asparaginase/Glu-tRNA(Gln) amidotransferase subunit D